MRSNAAMGAMRGSRRAALAVGLVLLAGCASAPPPKPAPPPPVGDAPLEREQRWLADWYRGTDVAVFLDDGGSLWVEVPLADAFDAGQTRIKPVLEKVLQRVAAGQQRIPGAQLRVAAPTDPDAGPVLADRRAVALRAYLSRRGVPPTAVTTVPAPRAGWVSLQMTSPFRPPAPVRGVL